MATPGYMFITDDQGNQIKSNSQVNGRTGAAEVLGFDHNIYIPSDPDTGALTGTRKHDAFYVTKAFCSASPILAKACASGKTLQQVMISWYAINNEGQEKEYFRHTLTNVKVVKVNPHMKEIKSKENEKYGHLEQIGFRYQTIQWDYLDGNISSSDTWNERT